jgi:hypothetical protein
VIISLAPPRAAGAGHLGSHPMGGCRVYTESRPGNPGENFQNFQEENKQWKA